MIICPQCDTQIFLDEEEREELGKLGAVETHDNTCRNVVLNQMSNDWHKECWEIFQSEYNAILAANNEVKKDGK